MRYKEKGGSISLYALLCFLSRGIGGYLENLVNRLIAIGYAPENALNIYMLYERQGDLDALESYLIVRECTETL